MKILSCLLLVISSVYYAQDLYPLGKYNNIIKHKYYTLSYSEEDEQAEWVYYELDTSQINTSVERKDNFKTDPLIMTSSAQLSDYKGSGYDRGHLAPSADMKHNKIAMSESFYMSNMSPQNPSFNRGIWKKIEKKIRDWTYLFGELLVITGPILDKDYLDVIGKNEVSVPKWYYKVVMDLDNYERCIAFLIENQKSSNYIESFVVTIDQIEEKSGIDFFYQMNDEIENKIESNKPIELWQW